MRPIVYGFLKTKNMIEEIDDAHFWPNRANAYFSFGVWQVTIWISIGFQVYKIYKFIFIKCAKISLRFWAASAAADLIVGVSHDNYFVWIKVNNEQQSYSQVAHWPFAPKYIQNNVQTMLTCVQTKNKDKFGVENRSTITIFNAKREHTWTITCYLCARI